MCKRIFVRKQKENIIIEQWRCSCRFILVLFHPYFSLLLSPSNVITYVQYFYTLPRIYGGGYFYYISFHHKPGCAISLIKQGSHMVWKTGKTGKKIMVREKSGKSQGILFWAKSQGKVREFCIKLPIAMKICCYSCRLSRMFVTVFTNMKVHTWILKNFCIFHCCQVLHQQH